jgi:hypothetical protein
MEYQERSEIRDQRPQKRAERKMQRGKTREE